MRINPHTISNSKLSVIPIPKLEQSDRDRIEAIRGLIMVDMEVDRFMFAETDLTSVIIIVGKGVSKKMDFSELTQSLKDELNWCNTLTIER